MKKTFRLLLSTLLLISLSTPLLADTIRLKDGSVIRGQVIGFKDQQFTILIGGNARGRRGQTTVYVEDVELNEFDAHKRWPPAPAGIFPRRPCRVHQIQCASLTTPLPIAQSTHHPFRRPQLRLSLRSKSASEPITQTTAGQTAVL